MQKSLHLGIWIDYSRDSLLTSDAKTLLREYYLREGERSPQEAFARASVAFCNGDMQLAQRIYDHVSNLHFMFSSPILSNAPLPNESAKSMPISCFLSYIGDDLHSIIDHSTEIRWLSVKGGGVGGHWSDVRSVSDKAPGPIPFLHTIDADMTAYRQGKTRKGSYAAYLDVSHPDVLEFLNMRVPTGDVNRKNLNLHHGLNITDEFMTAVVEGGKWDLIDPNTRKPTETLDARKLWQQILEVRYRTGEPYLFFIDTANRALPEEQREAGLRVRGSNLCLTGDTVVEVSESPSGENSKLVSLEDLTIDFELGLFEEIFIKSYADNSVVWAKATAVAETAYVKSLIEIVTQNGRRLSCTADHQVFTQNKGWVKASDLSLYDAIVELGQSQGQGISQINKIDLERGVPVYDATVPDTECFFANGILVHNCAEITLPTDEQRTAVCCLLSLNLEKYDDWKDTTIVEDLVEFLDNVIEFFIESAPDEMSKAKYSAQMERSLGLGVMGWHSYLQKYMIPFTSKGAWDINEEIFSNIQKRAIRQSHRLALERGPAPDMIKTRLRNANLTAIAPNANSSIIAGTSPSIEPLRANAYTQRTRIGSTLVKNKYLENLLDIYGMNTPDVWSSIITNQGSVAHLDFLDDDIKEVFKTATELDMVEVVRMAGARQRYICQSQSLNIFFPPKVSREYLNKVHIEAWRSGCKSLYYLRTEAASKAENVSLKVERDALVDYECASCQA